MASNAENVSIWWRHNAQFVSAVTTVAYSGDTADTMSERFLIPGLVGRGISIVPSGQISSLCYINVQNVPGFIYYWKSCALYNQTQNLNIFQEFDVFVSYCHEDNEWVCKELRPRLENSQPPFRLCLHERDFVAGAAVADNISAAINTSRRMVLLLSRAFLRSHWCYMEFRQAHYKVRIVSFENVLVFF